MNITLQSRLALNPELRLRPDVDRAIIVTRPQPLADRSYILRMVHPTEAVILCLLDGQRTVQQVGELWAELANKPIEIAHQDVAQVLQFYTTGERGDDCILIEVGAAERHRILSYDPLKFIIPASKINLKGRRLRIPYMVYFLPTLFCTQHCLYCYAKTSTKPESNAISTQRLREVFRELYKLGVEVIQLSGGEIFTKNDIFEILEMVVETGLLLDIPTKYGLSYEQVLRLKDLNIRTIQFSLDSVEPQTLDHIIGIKGYHLQAFKALNNLNRAGLAVRVNTVLTSLNIRGVGPLLDYLGESGNVFRVALTPYGRSSFRHYDRLFINNDEIKEVEEIAALRKERFPHMRVTVGSNGVPQSTDEEERRRAWEERAFCTAGRDGFVILPDGRVTVCEELYDHPAFIIGDLKRQSVMEMWNSPEALALINPNQHLVADGPCKTCSQFAQCHSVRGRCWRDVIKSYGWDKPHWPDPKCPQAPKGNRLG